MKPNHFIAELRSNFSDINGVGFIVNDEISNSQLDGSVDADDFEGLVMRLYFLTMDPEKEIKFFVNQYEEGQFLYLLKVTESIWFFTLSRNSNFAKFHFYIKYLLSDLEPDFVNEQAVEAKKLVDDSLASARRIQSLLLPDMKAATSIFNDSYFYFSPKDEVGGDFYWANRTKTHQWFVIGDCTGHSVEGALASVSVLSIMKQVFNSNMNPHMLIKEVHNGLKNIQRQDILGGYGIGCEMIVLKIDIKNHTVKYSGTGIPLYVMGEGIKVNKTKRSSIAPDRTIKFLRTRTLKLSEGEGIFTHSDGLTDQFGVNGKRLMKSGLIKSINEHNGVNHESIQQTFEKWRGKEEQTDDVVFFYLKP
jgi:hypothetical protein